MTSLFPIAGVVSGVNSNLKPMPCRGVHATFLSHNGNKFLLNNPQAKAQLLAYIQQIKNQIPNVLVTYADTWNTMVAHPNVISAVDVVAVNIYPFYENAAIDQVTTITPRGAYRTPMAT